MNAATAILLSVLVHLGGVGLDTTRDAALQWYRDAELQGQWELEATRSGVYRFASDGSLVIVERLREAEMVYAIQQYETVEAREETLTGPIPRALRALGTVSLQPQAQNLRAPRSSRGSRTVVVARVPVAWSRVAVMIEETEESGDRVESGAAVPAGDEAAPPEHTAAMSDSALTGDLSVLISPGQWSATHSDSGQVMVLQVR